MDKIEEGMTVWVKGYGRGVVVEVTNCEHNGILVKFDDSFGFDNYKHHHFWIDALLITTIPPLPDGYKPASNLPENNRDVMLLLADGTEIRGWCWVGRSRASWYSRKSLIDFEASLIQDERIIIGWRELR